MILKAYTIDENGFYLEDYIYEEGQELEENIITTIQTPHLYKPKWNGTEWVEGATQEYIDSINYIPLQAPTLEEQNRSDIDYILLMQGL